MFVFCVVMSTIGNIMVASSKSISVYAGSQVLFVLGSQGMYAMWNYALCALTCLGISLMLQILAGGTFPKQLLRGLELKYYQIQAICTIAPS
jgi:hypothetical protein